MESSIRRRVMPLNGIARNVRAASRWSTVCGKPLVSVAKQRRCRCRTPFGSVPVRVCGNSSIDTEKRADVENMFGAGNLQPLPVGPTTLIEATHLCAR